MPHDRPPDPRLVCRRRQAWATPVGEVVTSADCQIAAARGMRVATHHIRDFEDMRIEIVDT